MSEAKARELLREVEVYLAGMETRNEHLLARLRRYLAVVPAPAEPTDAQRSIAFNYAEGFAGASTVTAQEVLDAYRAIRGAAPAAEPVILSITHDRLVSPRHIEGVYDTSSALISASCGRDGTSANNRRPDDLEEDVYVDVSASTNDLGKAAANQEPTTAENCAILLGPCRAPP